MPTPPGPPDRPSPRPACPPCPVCHKPAATEFAPFGSATCRNRDLLAWLDGRYAIPGPPEEDA